MTKYGIISLICVVFTYSYATWGEEEKERNYADGEIVEFLITANKNEIAAAKKMNKKTTSAAVKSYAKLMLDAHGQNLKETLSITKRENIVEKETDFTASLKEQGKEELKTLDTLKGAALEKTYIKFMVDGHEKVLLKIDEFRQTVENIKLKGHLNSTRAHVLHHLEKARKIQKDQS